MDGNGTLSYHEVVGRLQARYGVRKEDAKALFERCDDDGNGVIDMDEFMNHYEDIRAIVGKQFPRRPDQRPAFVFDRGTPVTEL